MGRAMGRAVFVLMGRAMGRAVLRSLASLILFDLLNLSEP